MLSAELQDHGVAVAGNTFSVTEQRTSTVSGIQLSRYRAMDGETVVTAKIFAPVEPTFAETYTANQRQEVLEPYTERTAPYEGIIGRQRGCPDSFLPNISRKQRNSVNYTVYEAYADDALRSGVCSMDRAHYRRQGKLFYCPGHETMVQIEVFTPVHTEENTSILSTVRCRS